MNRLSPQRKKRIRKRLLEWFEQGRRDLPWRKNKDPYRVWVSEVMLQQTQVKTVIPYFKRFIRRFPTIRALAKASLDEVLPLWSGLGYYRRARHLHEAAQRIVEQHNGRFPRSFQEAAALPGLGRYSAGAVLSIAYGLDLPVVDGNVMRVFSRLVASELAPRSSEGQNAFWELAERLLPKGRAGDFNQALMELGARICTPKSPRCLLCPLASDCTALRKGDPQRYPLRPAKTPTRLHCQACTVIFRKGKVLLELDRQGRWYRDVWHLPFFAMASERLSKKRLQGQIRQRFGLEVEGVRKVLKNRFAITVHRVTQIAVCCEVKSGRVARQSGRRTQWISLKALQVTPLPSSQREIPPKLTAGQQEKRTR